MMKKTHNTIFGFTNNSISQNSVNKDQNYRTFSCQPFEQQYSYANFMTQRENCIENGKFGLKIKRIVKS